jgi:hypothetical protein
MRGGSHPFDSTVLSVIRASQSVRVPGVILIWGKKACVCSEESVYTPVRSRGVCVWF